MGSSAAASVEISHFACVDNMTKDNNRGKRILLNGWMDGLTNPEISLQIP